MIYHLVGDIHGNLHPVLDLIDAGKTPVLQIGDFGFEESYQYIIDHNIPSSDLQILGGNHDCMPVAKNAQIFYLILGLFKEMFITYSTFVEHGLLIGNGGCNINMKTV